LADIPGDASTTATIGVGGTVGGNLEVAGDHDWYKVTLTAGQAVVVTLNGVTLVDPYLYIRDSSGNLIYSNDDIVDGSNRNSEVAFNPSYTGTYYIDVGAWNEGFAGTYSVAVKPYTPPPLATNDQIADQLVNGFWGGDSHHFNVTQGGTITVNISTLTAAEKNLARAALAEWTDIIGVKFQEVTTAAQINFDHSEGADGSVAATDSDWTDGIITSSHVQISSSWVNTYGTGLYSYSFQTYVHEIGHALGLGHAGDYNGSATYPYDARFQNDAWSTSIMSYFDQSDNTYFAGQGFTVNFAVSPMAADILAMQTLYGLSTSTRTGDTTYGFNTSAGGIYDASLYPKAAYTIFDSGGTDTLDFSATAAGQLLNLNPETFSSVNGRTGNVSIARGVVIENAIGGNGADTIIGNATANVLKGGAGNDILTGGFGNDIFLDTIAGHNGDKITDFTSGDKIVFSDATLGSFVFSLSGSTLTYSGGSLTFGSAPVGAFSASAASGGVQLILGTSVTPIIPAVHNDFNGDHRSDILWQNNDGTVREWLGQSNGGFAGNVDNVNFAAAAGSRMIGTGDFNGDGYADALWQTVDGRVTDLLGRAGGGFIDNYAKVSILTGLDWQAVGTGDFNGDGCTDILWQNDDGTVRDWLGQTNGGFAGNIVNLNMNTGPAWHVVGTGDFNGDNRDDILWQNDDGTIRDWLGQTNGGFAGNIANLNINPGASWHVVGTGDFNGDGRSDILWRNDGGTVTEWVGQANGGFADNGANFSANLSAAWHAAAIGDFNGDGRDDILWQDQSGQVINWLAQPGGSFIDNSATVNINTGSSWHVQDPFVHDPFA
jgi:hypothetical protein